MTVSRMYPPSRSERRWLVAVGLALVVLSGTGLASSGSVSGFVSDSQGSPLSGVMILLLDQSGQNEAARTVSDDRGYYRITGLQSGTYTLSFTKDKFSSHRIESLTISRQGHINQTVRLGDPLSSRSKAHKEDRLLVVPVLQRWGTYFDSERFQLLPSPNDFWYLIENLELSSVTNRIDIGGIKGPEPALIGTSGSSWTQNEYRVNGANVTDPFEPGRTLFYPDSTVIGEFRISTASHGAKAGGPGARLEFFTPEPGPSWHGQIGTSFSSAAFTGDNLDEDLRGEGLTESERFRSFLSGKGSVGGPLGKQFAISTAFTIRDSDREVPGFAESVDAHLATSLVELIYEPNETASFFVLGSGQWLGDNFEGANSLTSPTATREKDDRYSLLQSRWLKSLGRSMEVNAFFSLARSNLRSRLQDSAQNGPARIELFTGRKWGSAQLEEESRRRRFTGGLNVQWLMPGWLGAAHLFEAGIEMGLGRVRSTLDAHRDLSLLFDSVGAHPRDPGEPDPVFLRQLNTPIEPRQAVRETAVFLQDQMHFPSRITLYLALRASFTQGWLPRQESPAGSFVPARSFESTETLISWNSVDPGIGVAIPIRSGTVARASLSRYGHLLPASYLDWQNPNALSSETYRWNDLNRDDDLQEGERGELIRVAGGRYSTIDRNLKRPYTWEFTVGADQEFGRFFRANVRLFHRRQKHLSQTINTGVPFEAFTPNPLRDPGGDGIFGTQDDRVFDVFEQDPASFGRDRYFLTSPDGLEALYQGLQVIIAKRFFGKWHFHFGFSAYRTEAFTNPGNSEFDNDTGMIGSLLTDPNTLINAYHKLFFDRSFTGRIAGYYDAPLDFRLAAITKYYDGEPFGRKLIVRGLNQSPFFVMATPPGDPLGHRTEFHLNVDLRISRQVSVGENQSINLYADIFNLLNANNKTVEADLTGLLFQQRIALEVQSPRSLRLGFRYSF